MTKRIIARLIYFIGFGCLSAGLLPFFMGYIFPSFLNMFPGKGGSLPEGSNNSFWVQTELAISKVVGINPYFFLVFLAITGITFIFIGQRIVQNDEINDLKKSLKEKYPDQLP